MMRGRLTLVLLLFLIISQGCRKTCLSYNFYAENVPEEYSNLTKVKLKLEKAVWFEDSAFKIELINNFLDARYSNSALYSVYRFSGIYPYPNGITDTINLPVFIDKRTMSFNIFYKKQIVDTLIINYHIEEEEIYLNDDCEVEGKWQVARVVPISVFEANKTLKTSLR